MIESSQRPMDQGNGRDGLEVLEPALSGRGGKLLLELRDNGSLAYAIAVIRPPLDEQE